MQYAMCSRAIAAIFLALIAANGFSSEGAIVDRWRKDGDEINLSPFVKELGLTEVVRLVSVLLIANDSPIADRERVARRLFMLAQPLPPVDCRDALSQVITSISIAKIARNEQLYNSLMQLSPTVLNDQAITAVSGFYAAQKTDPSSIKLSGWARLAPARDGILNVFQQRSILAMKGRNWRDDKLLLASSLALSRYGEMAAIEFSLEQNNRFIDELDFYPEYREWHASKGVKLQRTIGVDLAYVRSEEFLRLTSVMMWNKNIDNISVVYCPIVEVVHDADIKLMQMGESPTRDQHDQFIVWLTGQLK